MADLRFGSFLAPNMLPVYRAIADEVGARLGMSAELVVESDYENFRKDINDICFVCSLPFVMFEQQDVLPADPIAAPVLKGDRYGGKPVYFSDVIVHRDSGIRTFADLRGRSWAYNEPLSHSGYGITRYHLVRHAETDGFFGEVIKAGFHETAIRMVRDRDVDASAIDSQVLAIELRDHPDLAESLVVIDSLGPSTIQPVAVSKRFPEDFRDEVRDVFLGLHRVPGFKNVLGHGMMERFVSISHDAYEDIRWMVSACQQVGFMTIR